MGRPVATMMLLVVVARLPIWFRLYGKLKVIV